MATRTEAVQCGRDESMTVDPMTSPPYKWICVIEWKDTDTNKTHRGTGFKINFPHVDYCVVVTAAHVLWDHKLPVLKFPENVKLKFPGKDAFEVPETNFFIPKEYEKEELDCYDYGLIFCNKESSLSDGFGWTTQINEFELRRDNIIVCGYPKSDSTLGTPIEDLKMSIAGGKIHEVNDCMLKYFNDTDHGQSGSPLYLCINGRCWIVIGIHGGIGKGCNVGRRLDLEVIARFARAMNCQKSFQSAQTSRFHLDCQPDHTSEVICQCGSVRNCKKFYIYPIAMPPSLLRINILHEFVIECASNAFWYFSTEYNYRSRKASLCILYLSNYSSCDFTDRGKHKKMLFYIRKEDPTEEVYSLISVARPNYRVCMDTTDFSSKTVQCSKYRTVPKATSSKPYALTDEQSYLAANPEDKIKII